MTSLIFIVLQSLCTAVIAVSAVRVAIGLSALAAATRWRFTIQQQAGIRMRSASR